MEAESRLPHKVVLLLMWATAARVGDILQLAHEDLSVDHLGSVTMTFSRGKAVKIRGPYTVATTQLPTTNLQLLKRLWDPSRGAAPLFADMTAAHLLPTFRLVEPRLEAKSIRRGALQQMARHGVPMDVLMTYSGHLKEKTLLRYLRWGREAKAQHTSMAQAGTVLFPSHHLR